MAAASSHFLLEKKKPRHPAGFLVLPGGIEPTSEVPETPVLSIELWKRDKGEKAHSLISRQANYTAAGGVCGAWGGVIGRAAKLRARHHFQIK